MKLLLVTCIEEYEKDVKKILKHSGVQSFSYQEVRGYSNGGSLQASFMSENIPTASLLFTVFIENQCIDELFESFEEFNRKQAVNTKIHVACLDVNQSI
ncbi:MAG: hypothetical protein PHC38_11290 [Weeksellaceae bacterium]|jgi:nitrogen regulatory protein PII|nr:hypothetical protein [Weeksellaceae bacterium]